MNDRLSTECIVCHSIDWSPLWKSLERCGKCGFIRAAGIHLSALDQLYEEHYFRGAEYADYLHDLDLHRKNFSRRLSELKQAIGEFQSIFEIGCAYGLFLQMAREQGIQAHGVDISRNAISFAQEKLGLPVECGDFLALQPPRQKPDVICMWDTIEHLPFPDQFLQQIWRWLEPNGVLALTTGDIGSKHAKFRGRNWRMIHPPTHLHYFDQQTMNRLLADQGFEVVRIQTASLYRNLHSMLSGLCILGRTPWKQSASIAKRIIPVHLQKRIGKWVDLGDIMFVIAKKRA